MLWCLWSFQWNALQTSELTVLYRGGWGRYWWWYWRKISSYVLCEATRLEKQGSLTHLTGEVNEDDSSRIQSLWTEVETFPIKIQLFYFLSFLFHLSKVLGWRDGMTLHFTGAIWSRVVLVLNWFIILIYIVAHSYITMSNEGSNKVCLEQWIADMVFISNKTILQSEIKSINDSTFKVKTKSRM